MRVSLRRNTKRLLGGQSANFCRALDCVTVRCVTRPALICRLPSSYRSTMPLPAPLSRLWHDGRAVLRAQWHFRDADLGQRVRVWGRPAVSNFGRMRIADRVRLVSTIATTELVAGKNGVLDIGESAFINYGCSISASLLVKIGPHCNIGTHVIIMDSDFHRIEPERRTESPEPLPIILEENVWLGARVIVMRGVTIGAGSVIGAGSIVTKDIPARSVAVGMPAKVIRTL